MPKPKRSPLNWGQNADKFPEDKLGVRSSRVEGLKQYKKNKIPETVVDRKLRHSSEHGRYVSKRQTHGSELALSKSIKMRMRSGRGSRMIVSAEDSLIPSAKQKLLTKVHPFRTFRYRDSTWRQMRFKAEMICQPTPPEPTVTIAIPASLNIDIYDYAEDNYWDSLVHEESDTEFESSQYHFDTHGHIESIMFHDDSTGGETPLFFAFDMYDEVEGIGGSRQGILPLHLFPEGTKEQIDRQLHVVYYRRGVKLSYKKWQHNIKQEDIEVDFNEMFLHPSHLGKEVDVFGWWEKQVFKNSFINGSHGEFTEDDDMSDGNAARCRMHREAHTSQFQRKTNSSNAARRVKTKDKDETNSKPSDDESEGELIGIFGYNFEAGDLWISVINECGVYYDGTSFRVYDPSIVDKIFLQEDKAFAVVSRGMRLKVIACEYGVYKQTSTNKGAMMFLEPYFELFNPSVEFGVNPKGLETLPIDRKFMRELQKSFPSASLDKAHAVEACCAAITRSESKNKGFPVKVLTNTVTMFLYQQEIIRDAIHNGKLLGREKPFHLDNLEKTEYCRLGITQQYTSPWLALGETCVIKDDYIMRDDFLVSERSRGFKMVDTNGEDAKVDPGFLDTKYYKFLTSENLKPKYYRTVMSQFTAADDSPVAFMLYDVNGANACKALKRMFGTYENNDVYRFFQYNLSIKLFDSHLLTGEISRGFCDKVYKVMRVRARLEADDFGGGGSGVVPFAGVNLTRVTGFVVGTADHHHIVPRFDGRNVLYGTKGDNDIAEDACKMIEPSFGSENPNGATRWPELYGKVQNSISEIYGKLLGRCSRGFLSMVVDGVKNSLNWGYYSVYEKYLTYLNMYDSRKVNVDMPHVKKQLRQKFFNNVQVHDDLDILVTRLDATVKKEFAKVNKVPRLFVSYGAGGIYASELPEYVKVCIHGEYYLPGERVNTTIYVMSKAKSGELDEIFRRCSSVCQMQNEILIVLYSDDSMMVGNIDGKLVMMNLDISSCDSSNRFPIFQAVAGLVSKFSEERAIGLVRQCCLPMSLRNPSNPDEAICFDFDGPFEGSGTLLTTICNHVASTFIAASIHTVINNSVLPVNECVRIGALMVGHKMTVVECQRFEQLQFLKRSPIRCTDGVQEDWYACLNYGTIFRGFGTVEGDLTCEMLGMRGSEFARLTWTERMDKFLKVVVQGLVTEPSSRITDALEHRFADTSEILETESVRAIIEQHYTMVDKVERTVRPRIVEQSLLNRYNCEDYEISQLCEQITALRVGTCVASSACHEFFATDY